MDLFKFLDLLTPPIGKAFLNGDYSPNLHLRILPRWGNAEKRQIILRLEVENVSKIIVPLTKNEQRLQVLVHSNSYQDGISPELLLSGFVPFDLNPP